MFPFFNVVSVKSLIQILCCLALAHPDRAEAQDGTHDTVHVCGEEFPPFSYSGPDGTYRGATVDLLNEVSDNSGFDFQIWLGPWKRCFSNVRAFGSGGDFEMFLDATSNPERRKDFRATDEVYATREGLFFSRTGHPRGLENVSLSFLRGKKFCGLLGNSYSWLYGLVEDPVLDLQSSSLTSAMRKLSFQRCDFVAFSIEVVEGKKAVGELQLGPDIDYVPFPGRKNAVFHHWISRRSPRADRILEAINQQIIRMAGPRYEALFRRHNLEGSGLKSATEKNGVVREETAG